MSVDRSLEHSKRVVMIGGDVADVATTGAAARAAAAAFDAVATPEEALARIAARGCDVLVVEDEALEESVPLRRVIEEAAEAEILVVCRHPTFAAAASAVTRGATALLASPVATRDAEAAVRACLENRRARVTRVRATEPASGDDVLGASTAMQRVFVLMARLADGTRPVLIGGEPGTGKEHVARALHARSPRAGGPFVVVDAGALGEDDVQRTLFGESGNGGRVAAARGGTLFVSGVDRAPLAAQAGLARALREVRSANGSVDVRIMASAAKNLANEAMAMRFRDDLRQEVEVMSLLLPPLRERDGDILLLAAHFVRREAAEQGIAVTGIREDATQRLAAYAWPGNVAELENVIAHAVAVASHDHLTVADLPSSVTSSARARTPSFEPPSALVSLEELQSRYILHVLRETGGNRNEAASILGLDRTTLWRRLERMRRKNGDATS